MSSCSTDSGNNVGEHCVKGVRAVTAVVEVTGESREAGAWQCTWRRSTPEMVVGQHPNARTTN